MARTLLRVDHPSVNDLESAINRAEDTKKEATDRDYYDLKCRIHKRNEGSDDVYVTEKEESRFRSKNLHIQSFQERQKFFRTFLDGRQYYLGHVVAGSGMYRTRQQAHMTTGDFPSVLDWALISIDPQRLGENKVRSSSSFGKCVDRWRLPVLSLTSGAVKPAHAKSPDLMTPISFQPTVQQGPEYVGRLWKSGRSTGLTSGDYKCLVQAEITRELDEKGELVVKATHEHMVSTSDGAFGEPGDSGSFVFDRYGGVMGMVLAGFERKETVYFAHIDNIFNDIKEVSGAEDVRIAV